MKQIAVIISIYFLLSWLLYCHVPNQKAHFDIDSYGYHDVAMNFYQHHELLNPILSERAPVQPVGYPFFIGLIYKIMGDSIGAIIAVQILLMAIVLLLLMLTASLLFGSTVALVCGVLAAFNIGFLVYPQFLLAETVLLFLLMLFFYFFVRYVQENSIRYLCFSAMILGLSTIIKPTAFGFPVIIIPVIIWHSRRSFWVAIKSINLFLILFLMPIFCYMMRNYWIYGYYSFAPMLPLNMYQCLLAKVMSHIHGESIQSIIDTQLRFTAINSFNPAGWAHARELFYEYINKYPTTFIYIWVQNVLKTVFGLFSTQLKVLIEPHVQGGDCSYFMQQGTILNRMQAYIEYGITQKWLFFVAYAEVLFNFLRWLLVIFGFCILWGEKKYGMVFIFVLCIVQLCGVTGMDGCCRYRITCEPILLLMSAYTIVHAYNRYKKRCKYEC